MICLNKADEGALRHLSYNQSPPALAPGATTREDMNGMANLREYVAAGQDDASGGGTGSMLGQTAMDEKMHADARPPREEDAAAAPDARRWPNQLSLRRREALAGCHGQHRLVQEPFTRCLERLGGWTICIPSALFLSYVVFHLGAVFGSSMKSAAPAQDSLVSSSNNNINNHSAFVPGPFEAPPPQQRQLVQVMKRSTCADGNGDDDAYNLGLHVAALFIILFVSTMGCAFPIMATKFPGLRIPRRFFFAIRHFGTGVLIATAFCHLLPTAFTSLGNPCLGEFWTQKYEAMPGAIALGAIFLVSVIEMVFHPSRHIQPADIVTRSSGGGGGGPDDGADKQPIRDMGTLHGHETSIGQGLTHLDQVVLADRVVVAPHHGAAVADDAGAKKTPVTEEQEERSESSDHRYLTPEQKRNKDRLQCILLEMGILFHSIFIGMALSVSIGSDFVVLLIAIVFHQTFEGLALGSRISAIEWGTAKTWQPWLMALAYGCTTPLGQAIGLATHTLYSPESEIGLIVVGVMNAISAGLLTFASLVELLSEDFLSDESWRYLRGRSRVVACLLVFFGAFFMSLVGAWA